MDDLLAVDGRPRPLAVIGCGLRAGARYYPKLIALGVLWTLPWYGLVTFTELGRHTGLVWIVLSWAISTYASLGVAASSVRVLEDPTRSVGAVFRPLLSDVGRWWPMTLFDLVQVLPGQMVGPILLRMRLPLAETGTIMTFASLGLWLVMLPLSWFALAGRLMAVRHFGFVEALRGSVRLVRYRWWRVQLIAGVTAFPSVIIRMTLPYLAVVVWHLLPRSDVVWGQHVVSVLLGPLERAIMSTLFLACETRPVVPDVEPAVAEMSI